MKRVIQICFLFTLFSMLSLQGTAQGFLKADGKRIVDGTGKEIILRGMGLGGWMLQEPYMLQLSGVAGTQGGIRSKIAALIGEEKTAAFYDAWLTNHCRKSDIDSMAAWGFNSVRLPMHYNLYTLPLEKEPVAGQNTWIEKGFAMTDSLLSWCKANNLYLILDLHAAPGGQGADIAISDRDTTQPSLWQSEGARQKTIALWRKLAERYAGEEWMGGYDLINEPNWGFTDARDKNGLNEKKNEPLRQLLVDITKAIREVDQKHIIIIEGNGWGNNYNGVFPLWDNNTVISFHKYWNHNDQASLQGMLATREKQNAPIWLGESGENSNVWFRSAIELLEKNNIGWAWWPLKKLGFNNPLQIKVPESYQQVLNYWKGSGTQPSATNAFEGLMQLAENLKTENNIYHKDVVDAMFRQVNSSQTIPFKKHLIANKAIVYAVDYDLGRNGFAYYDLDTANYRVATGKNVEWNKGRTYRNDGVDIATCTAVVTNGYCVGWTESGEWLQYTINVQKSGTYQLQISAAAKDSSGKIEVLVDNKAVAKGVVLPQTNSFETFKSTTVKSISLTKGVHRLRIKILNGGVNLNYLQFQLQ